MANAIYGCENCQKLQGELDALLPGTHLENFEKILNDSQIHYEKTTKRDPFSKYVDSSGKSHFLRYTVIKIPSGTMSKVMFIFTTSGKLGSISNCWI